MGAEPQTVTLPNGLRVILVERPEFETVAVMAVVGAGSRCDPPGYPGLAHLVEHSMFRARDKDGGVLRALHEKGVEMNGWTGLSLTSYSIVGHHWDTDIALEGMAELVGYMHDNPEIIELEKSIVTHEMALSGESTKENVVNVGFRGLFTNPELQHTPIGTLKALRRIGLEDVEAFHRGWYCAGNIVVSIAGRFDREHVVARARALFGHVLAGHPAAPRVEAVGRRRRRICIAKPQSASGTAAVVCSFPIPKLSPQGQGTLSLLAGIYCQGAYSRLNRILREDTGWAYMVDSELLHSGDFGMLQSRCVTDNATARHVLRSILGEAERIAAEGVLEEEFDAARERAIRAALMGADYPATVAYWSAVHELLADAYAAMSPAEWVRVYRHTDQADLERLAKVVLAPNNAFVHIIANLSLWRKFWLRRTIAKQVKHTRRRELAGGLDSTDW